GRACNCKSECGHNCRHGAAVRPARGLAPTPRTRPPTARFPVADAQLVSSILGESSLFLRGFRWQTLCQREVSAPVAKAASTYTIIIFSPAGPAGPARVFSPLQRGRGVRPVD